MRFGLGIQGAALTSQSNSSLLSKVCGYCDVVPYSNVDKIDDTMVATVLSLYGGDYDVLSYLNVSMSMTTDFTPCPLNDQNNASRLLSSLLFFLFIKYQTYLPQPTPSYLFALLVAPTLGKVRDRLSPNPHHSEPLAEQVGCLVRKVRILSCEVELLRGSLDVTIHRCR